MTKTLDPEPEKPEPRKTLILKNLDPEKPGPRKTWTLKNWTLKNQVHEKRGKQWDAEKILEEHMV